MRKIGLLMCALTLACGDSPGRDLDDDDIECTDDPCDSPNDLCGNADEADGTACDVGGQPGVCRSGVCEDAGQCENINCDDSNPCTVDACDPTDGSCRSTNAPDGASCDSSGLPGLCASGVCEDAGLCESIDCNDINPCTVDACDPADGLCGNDNVADGTSCDFNGLPGLCASGLCENAVLCENVDCDDGNPCTVDTCDPADGSCANANAADGTICDTSNVCAEGTCVARADPEPQTVPQNISCTILGNTATIPVDLTVDPDAEFTSGGSASVSTVLLFTIPAGVGDFMIPLVGDIAEVTAATLEVSVNGGTPTPIVLTRAALPLIVDVDADDDGMAEAVPFSTDIDITTITNDGSPNVDFEVTALGVTIKAGIFTIALSSSTNCTIDPPVSPIAFPAN